VLLLRIQARYIHHYNFHFLFCLFQLNLFLPKPNQLLVPSGSVVNLNFPNLNELFSLRTCPLKNFFFFFSSDFNFLASCMSLNIPSRFAHKLSLLFRLLSRAFSDFLPTGLSKPTKAASEASSSSNSIGSEAKGVAADLLFGFSFQV
jgi:hypothetical protein